MDIPLPWERLLWSGRPRFPQAFPARLRARLGERPGERYVLTDLRLVRIEGEGTVEVALYDIDDVSVTRSRVDRWFGTSTIAVHSRRAGAPLLLRGIDRRANLAALIDLMAGETRTAIDPDAVTAALAWNPRDATRRTARGTRGALTTIAAVAAAVFAVVIGLHGRTAPAVYSAADPIYPSGQKRSPAEVVRFMQAEVMPWARETLGPLKGGPDRITCETCHGRNAGAHGWQMPAVAALPEPDIRDSGWEHYGGPMDAQLRNAIYGYRAESGNQARAAYMRQVVMPGMARLLHRPAYDFTRPYEYNRERLAFGCYHCHRVK